MAEFPHEVSMDVVWIDTVGPATRNGVQIFLCIAIVPNPTVLWVSLDSHTMVTVVTHCHYSCFIENLIGIVSLRSGLGTHRKDPRLSRSSSHGVLTLGSRLRSSHPNPTSTTTWWPMV